MPDVTQILANIEQGDPTACEQLLPLVYDELRKLAAAKMAAERKDHSLQATGLVHEAYLRLVGQHHFENRRHFFAAAAEAMRRILVEQARSKQSQKRGGRIDRADIDPNDIPINVTSDPVDVLAVHEVVDELAAKSPRKAELVKLRYFLGCSVAEAATILNIAAKTAEEDWTFARAWLRRQWRRGDRKDGE